MLHPRPTIVHFHGGGIVGGVWVPYICSSSEHTIRSAHRRPTGPALLQTQLTPKFPPTFQGNGKEDTLVLPDKSQNWLRDMNVKTELDLLDFAGHTLMDVPNPS